jgi:hypothetical protein
MDFLQDGGILFIKFQDDGKSYIKIQIFTIGLFNNSRLGSSVSQNKQTNNDIEYRDIASYLDLDIMLESTGDTVVFNDKVSLTVIFRNKTDTSFYFYPDALVSLTRELHGIFEFDINFIFLSKYSNVSNLILIEPYGTYSKTYQVIIEKPWCISGKNELFVMYLCKDPKGLKGHKQQPEVLYGRLQSSIFELYVKEK